MAVRLWQKRLLNRLTILQKLALNNFGNQRHCFFLWAAGTFNFSFKTVSTGCPCNILPIQLFPLLLWYFFFAFNEAGHQSLSWHQGDIFELRWEKNGHSWGKQTSGANLSHVSVSPTQSTLRIFYVIDIKWIHFNYIQFYPPSYLNLVI